MQFSSFVPVSRCRNTLRKSRQLKKRTALIIMTTEQRPMIQPIHKTTMKKKSKQQLKKKPWERVKVKLIFAQIETGARKSKAHTQPRFNFQNYLCSVRNWVAIDGIGSRRWQGGFSAFRPRSGNWIGDSDEGLFAEICSVRPKRE